MSDLYKDKELLRTIKSNKYLKNEYEKGSKWLNRRQYAEGIQEHSEIRIVMRKIIKMILCTRRNFVNGEYFTMHILFQ